MASSFRCKYGELSIDRYNKDFRENENTAIKAVVNFCQNRSIDIFMCEVISAVEPENYSSISELLKFYIQCITRNQRYGIVNDIVIIQVDIANIEGSFADVSYQIRQAGFIPFNFTVLDFDDPKIYYAHENDFARMLVDIEEQQ